MPGAGSFKKQWWISFSIVFGTLAISAAGLYYLSGDLATQSAKITTDRSFIVQQTAVVADLASLESDQAKAAPYLAAMQKLLPTHDALIGFPQWVDALAAAHNVTESLTFTGKNVGATASSPGSDSFSLNVSGASNNIIAFLDDMESKAPGFLLILDSFNFTGGGGSYTFTAQGRVFSRQ